MNEYEKQAQEFLKSTKCQIKTKFLRVGVMEHWVDGDEERDIYQVTIKTPRHSYTFEYGQSLINSWHIKDRKGRIVRVVPESQRDIEWVISGEEMAYGCLVLHKGCEPTPYEILASLTPEHFTSRDEVVEELLGNCDYSIKTLEQYNKFNKLVDLVMEMNLNLMYLFTTEQLEQLAEIV